MSCTPLVYREYKPANRVGLEKKSPSNVCASLAPLAILFCLYLPSRAIIVTTQHRLKRHRPPSITVAVIHRPCPPLSPPCPHPPPPSFALVTALPSSVASPSLVCLGRRHPRPPRYPPVRPCSLLLPLLLVLVGYICSTSLNR